MLIGGGVGINPLVSILMEYVDLLNIANLQSENNIKPGKVHLLYSGRTAEELVFKVSYSKYFIVMICIMIKKRVLCLFIIYTKYFIDKYINYL